MKKLLFFCLLLVSQMGFSQTVYETIMSNLHARETKGDVAIIDRNAEQRLNTIRADGRWNNITYYDSKLLHLHYIKDMAKAYTKPGSKYKDSPEMFNAISRAFDAYTPRSDEPKAGFVHEITQPTLVGEALVIMRFGKERIPTATETRMITIMKPDKLRIGDGTNSMEQAVPFIYKGCLLNDKVILDKAVHDFYDPITYSQGDLLADNSFVLHGNQIQMNGYGMRLVVFGYSAAALLQGTEYSISESKLGMLNKFYKDTFIKAGRGGYPDWTSYGRGFVRGDGVVHDRTIGIDNRFLKEVKFLNAPSPVWDEIDAGTYQKKPVHNRYWISDFDLHIREDYTFALRTISNRSIRMEKSADENLLGKFMSDGSTNIQRIGQEYRNIFGIWEYDKIPGTTSRDFPTDGGSGIDGAAFKLYHGSTAFVGGVTDSLYGVTAYNMSYDQVQSKKSWFFFDKEVLCMGAGIRSAAAEKVTTTVNQCWLYGDIQVGSASGVTNIANASHSVSTTLDPKWVLHDSIGYFFPSGGNIKVSNMIQKGNWRRVGHSVRQLNAAIQGPVFKMWFDHDVKPKNSSYAYVVVPGVSEQDMGGYNISDIKIVKNTDSVQAVRHLGLDMLQVIFYKSGTLNDEGISISVDQPCVLMVKNVSTANPVLSITDPARLTKNIEVLFKFPAIAGRERVLAAQLSGAAGTTTRYVLSDKLPERPITTVTATEDSYVANGSANADKNYGKEPALKLGNPSTGTVREVFLKFDPSVLDRPVTNSYAKLRVFLNNAASTISASDFILYKTGNDWTETGINWNNKPVAQTEIVSQQKLNARGYIDWDITSVLNELPAGDMLSFKLVIKDRTFTGDAQFGSKESGLKPKIVIEEPSTSLQKVGAVADSYVSSAAAEVNKNFGLSNLLVSRRTVNDIFLKFDVSQVHGKVITARLKMKRYNSHSAMTLYGVSDNTWTETGITFNNKPKAGASSGTGSEQSGVTYFDLMNLVKEVSKDSLLSMKITTGSATLNNTFFSKEASDAASRPVLECLVDTTWYAAPAPALKDLSVVGDAYVSSRPDDVSTNFGSSIRLYVKPDINASFLKFDLDSAKGVIRKARLKLTRVAALDNGSEIHLYGVSDNSWSENGVNWNNKPLADEPLIGSSKEKGTVSFDVTSLLKNASEEGFLSLKLLAPAGALTGYLHSNQATEATFRPVLECIVDTTNFEPAVMLAKTEMQAVKSRVQLLQNSNLGEEKSDTGTDLIPANLVTPNGDGRNDTWQIKNISQYPKNSVKVFTVNGQLIYDKQSYDNSWNATYNGAPLADGAYVYIIDKGDQAPLVKGVLNVISNFK